MKLLGWSDNKGEVVTTRHKYSRMLAKAKVVEKEREVLLVAFLK